MNHPFEDDFGGGRHLQVVATALDQFGPVTAQQAGKGVLGKTVWHRGHGTEDGRRVSTQRHGHRERLARVFLAPFTVIQRAAAVTQPAHDDLVAADHLLTVDTEVLPVLVRPLGDRQAPGDQRGDIAWPAGLHGQGRKVDVVAFDHHFLADRVFDDLGRHGDDLAEDRQLGPGVFQPLRRLGLLEERQQLADFTQLADRFGAHAQRDALGGTEQVAEHGNVKTGRFFEEQGRALGAQGAIAHLGHFEHWGHRNLDALEFAALFQAADKVAQVAILHA
ncbi:hypothetical protein D3C76_865270 [compost metagenome]